MNTNIVMPQLGESLTEGMIARWLKREGESISQFEPLLEVDIDKVTTEIPATHSGVVLRILAAEGMRVKAGEVIAIIGETTEVVSHSTTAAPADILESTTIAPPLTQLSTDTDVVTRAVSPLAARIAADHGIDPVTISGTGQAGRVVKQDVMAHLAARLELDGHPQNQEEILLSPAVAGLCDVYQIDLGKLHGSGKGGRVTRTDVESYLQTRGIDRPTSSLPLVTKPADASPKPLPLLKSSPAAAIADEVVPLTAMRRSIAEHMVRSVKTSPHVTTVMEADLSAVTEHREANKIEYAQQGAKLTYTSYFIAATAAALRQHRILNASWNEAGIVLHRDINIGMAVSLGEEGLIVPVIRHADEKSLLGLARAISDLVDRARTGTLQPDEVKDGTFTVTNHGSSGSILATPIINQPQAAILGVGAVQRRVIVIDDAIAIRSMVYLSLTFDHRVLDSASADAFLATIRGQLETAFFIPTTS
jgi:2-oxoglutarate dehydrogenase E2 component (dihydrolipoamide succinyltransferase)